MYYFLKFSSESKKYVFASDYFGFPIGCRKLSHAQSWIARFRKKFPDFSWILWTGYTFKRDVK